MAYQQGSDGIGVVRILVEVPEDDRRLCSSGKHLGDEGIKERFVWGFVFGAER